MHAINKINNSLAQTVTKDVRKSAQSLRLFKEEFLTYQREAHMLTTKQAVEHYTLSEAEHKLLNDFINPPSILEALGIDTEAEEEYLFADFTPSGSRINVPKLDQATRWSSVYRMLHSVIRCTPIIRRYSCNYSCLDFIVLQ